MTAPNMLANIDQGAATVREVCSKVGADLTDPSTVRALHLLLLNAHQAMAGSKDEVERVFRVLLVVDYWLTAIKEANRL